MYALTERIFVKFRFTSIPDAGKLVGVPTSLLKYIIFLKFLFNWTWRSSLGSLNHSVTKNVYPLEYLFEFLARYFQTVFLPSIKKSSQNFL